MKIQLCYLSSIIHLIRQKGGKRFSCLQIGRSYLHIVFKKHEKPNRLHVQRSHTYIYMKLIEISVFQ